MPQSLAMKKVEKEKEEKERKERKEEKTTFKKLVQNVNCQSQSPYDSVLGGPGLALKILFFT